MKHGYLNGIERTLYLAEDEPAAMAYIDALWKKRHRNDKEFREAFYQLMDLPVVEVAETKLPTI